jgi:DNA polymerase III delta prime subunit
LTQGSRKKAPEMPDTSLPDWRDLIGMGESIDAWRHLVTAGRMPQVLLLEGRSGCGKRALLTATCALHLCRKQSACGECSECRQVLAGTHPDLLWVEGDDGKLRIEDAAAVQEHLSYAPGNGSRDRIVVIVNADQLMVQAANRLLKTLEEPPEWGRIFMSTSRIDSILPTVLSRCVRWKVMPPAQHLSLKFLRGAYERAGRDVPSDDDLFDLLKRSGLAPGKALQRAGLTAGSTDKEELDQKLSGLLQAGSAHAAVQAAAALVDGSASGLAELIEELEIAINNQYWAALHQQARPDLVRIRRRRELLREIRLLAVKNKVALNAQMVLEALGFPSAAELS